MRGGSSSAPSLSHGDGVLEAKPLRSLSPLFPAPFGSSTHSSTTDPPLVYVTTFPPSPSSFPSGHPASLFPTFGTPQASNPGPVNLMATHADNGSGRVGHGSHSNDALHHTSISASFDTPLSVKPLNGGEDGRRRSSGSRRKNKQPIHSSSYLFDTSDQEGSENKKVVRKKPKKIQGLELALLSSSSNDPRESVEIILMIFDALRRRLLQLDEVNDLNKRADLRASAMMMANDLRANKDKRIGPVPGVDIGDIFYFRMELCLIGIHAPSMGGIDYMNARFGTEDDPVAISVVSAGGYENEDDDVDVLVYSGQGGSSKNDKPMDDQKLERGNLALERSLHRANQIRVIRGVKDTTVLNGKIYIYDGLYKIHESWVEKGKSGFNVFKYKFVREPGQADGIGVWKSTQRWKENPSCRGTVILPDISSGVENLPVCLVNEVDHEKGPSLFRYVTEVKYIRPISSMKPLQGCTCLSVCLPGDANCSCARQNGGYIPYSSSGFLVCRKHIVYECNDSCHCSVNCRNRVTQKGVRFHFEVFRTRDRGWGLRSWDPIRAGTFICEYTGEVIDKVELTGYGEADEYIFQTNYVDEKTFKWNYRPELLEESTTDTASEEFRPLPIIISAKNMGNISRFMNHSCCPNVFWQPVQHDHSDEGYPHIMFFAIKHIPPMTELTYDYGTSDLGFGRARKCLCRSSKCRGYFG